MKIRNGFVSNSSSSSFCIYGVYFSENKISSIVKNIPKDVLENMDYWKDFINSEDAQEKTIDVFSEECDVFSLFDEVKGVSVEFSPEGYYIGRSYMTLKDNETGADFKKSVEDILRPFGFNKFGKFEECFNDNF